MPSAKDLTCTQFDANLHKTRTQSTAWPVLSPLLNSILIASLVASGLVSCMALWTAYRAIPSTRSIPVTITRPSPTVQNPPISVEPPRVFVMPTTRRHLSPSVQPFYHQGTLVVAAVRSPTIVFEKDRFKHGFHYDAARHYAAAQGMKLKFVTVKSNQTALQWLHAGKARLALTTSHDSDLSEGKVKIDLSCQNQSALSDQRIIQQVDWVFKSADDPLSIAAEQYFCDSQRSEQLAALASFYDRHYLDRYLVTTVNTLQQRLPQYKHDFQQAAKLFGIDWQFLAAVGYQESYLDPTSVSPTGVRGLMMLTQDTANEMGVVDRENPTQSIIGGTQFLYAMLQKYRTAPYPDRYWLALVGYNMGPGALDEVRSRVKQLGQDPNSWLDVQSYLIDHQSQNSRYTQTLQYTKRIRAYVELIKTHNLTFSQCIGLPVYDGNDWFSKVVSVRTHED